MSQQTNEIREVLTALKEDQATFSAAVNRVPACDKGLKALEEIEEEQSEELRYAGLEQGELESMSADEPEPKTESTLPWPVDENGEPIF
jgi:hypothetical protein